MNRQLESDLEKLLEKHAIVDVLAGLAEIMKQPGGDSELLVALGKVLKTLTDQAFWD